MIYIVSRSGAPEALECPAFICDVCGEQVAGRGNVEWAHKREVDKSFISPLFTTHKEVCSRKFRAWEQKFGYPQGDGWRYGWRELEHFMKHLTHNASNSFSDDEGTRDGSAEYHPRQVVWPKSPLPSMAYRGLGSYGKGKK